MGVIKTAVQALILVLLVILFVNVLPTIIECHIVGCETDSECMRCGGDGGPEARSHG
jgi:hypothetical protein